MDRGGAPEEPSTRRLQFSESAQEVLGRPAGAAQAEPARIDEHAGIRGEAAH